MYFNKKYFLAFIVILLIEILIATYATGFLRHTIGDVLAVILLYCFIKNFLTVSITKTLIIVLVISFSIEFLQLTNLQDIYPERMEKYLRIILGNSFDVGDLLTYCIGALLIFIFEKNRHQF